MTAETVEHWRKLCEQAAQEQDPQKLQSSLPKLISSYRKNKIALDDLKPLDSTGD
jgi:hypothetical protein